MQDAVINTPYKNTQQADVGQDAPANIAKPRSAATPPQTACERLDSGPQDLAALSCGYRTPRQLRRWLTQYQSTGPDPQRTAGTLRALLAEIARWQATPQRRLACLEALRPPVFALCEALTPTSDIQLAPTPDSRRSVLTACILLQHLAQADSSVAVALVRQPRGLFYRATLARSLHRAQDGYRRLIRTSSRFYLATPKHCWVRMQALVQLAREQQLESRRVGTPFTPEGTARKLPRRENVIAPYLHAALFASANPLQLGADEQQQLWRLSARWAVGTLLRANALNNGKYLLASLRLDQPPIPSVRLQRTGVDLKHFSAPLGWAIDLAPSLLLIDKRLRKPTGAASSLIEHVRTLWSGEQGRHTVRTPVNLRCEVVLGISGICHQLRNAHESGTADNRAPLAAGADQDTVQRLVMDVGTIDFSTGRALDDYEVTLPSAPTLRHEDEDRARQQRSRYQSASATLLNLSARGAGLRLPQALQGRIHCGDLIGLTLNGRWQVAQVRWQYALPDHCRAGVELLGGRTTAVWVHRYNSNGGRTDPMPALLTGDANGIPELILPIPLFQRGDQVDIVSAGQRRSVTLHQQTSTSASFAIFEFS